MTTSQTIRLTAEQEQRLDVYLAEQMPDYTRSRLQNMIRSGAILVNGKNVKSGFKLSCGDAISITVEEAAPMRAVAEDIDLNILYEDHDIIVVNKPQGISTA